MVGHALACSEPVGWEPETLEVRARKLQWIVYGTVVTDEMVLVENQRTRYVLKPMCWLKHTFASSADVNFANITILEIKIDCIANSLEKDKDYILFLSREGEEYTIEDVNVESGVIENPADWDFQAVHRGLEGGMGGEPDGKCLEGVQIPCFVGEVEKSVCDQGVTIKVALLSVIVAAILAVIVN